MCKQANLTAKSWKKKKTLKGHASTRVTRIIGKMFSSVVWQLHKTKFTLGLREYKAGQLNCSEKCNKFNDKINYTNRS